MTNDLQYKQEVSKHGKKDAIIVICFIAYFFVRAFALLIIFSAFEIPIETRRIVNWTIIFVDILTVLAIILIRKQSLASIGLHKENFWRALRLGLLFGLIPIIVLGLLQGVVNGWEFNSLVSGLLAFVTVFIMAFREDLMFVGFIQTRLYGLVKNDFWAINIGAMIFALAHAPAQLMHGIPMGVVNFLGWLIFCFFMHRAFIMLFKKYFSLVLVTTLHTLWNFSGMGLWSERAPMMTIWAVVAFFIFIFAVDFWYGKWNKPRTATDELKIVEEQDKTEN